MSENNSTSNNSTPQSEKEIAAARRNAAFNWLVAIVAIVVIAIKFPSFTQTALVFIITLGVLVFVHEWGHYQFGRWGGMKINRFGIGFPPWVFTKRYKGIDYSIGALPIGGMVDIAGLGSEEEMVATAKSDAETLSQSQRPARRDVPHGQKLFQDAALGWRFMTLFAGPLMNFVLAIVMFIGVFTIWGVIDQQKSGTSNRIGTVNYNTPADKAGLRDGDKIIGVNGVATEETGTISRLIRNSGSRFAEAELSTPAVGFDARVEAGEKPITPVTLTVLRDGKTLQKRVTPTFQDLPMLTSNGIESYRSPAIGIEFEENLVFQKVGVAEAAKMGVLMSAGMTVQLLQVVGKAITFQLNPAERRGIGGPVKIAQAVGKASRGGPQQLFLFAGLLSMNLGLMNLLPFPALDGGRILFLGYEFIFRKPVDSKKESVVHMAGMVMLLAFMLFITVRDVLPWLQSNLKNVF
jgi:regulator of sigma E protease